MVPHSLTSETLKELTPKEAHEASQCFPTVPRAVSQALGPGAVYAEPPSHGAEPKDSAVLLSCAIPNRNPCFEIKVKCPNSSLVKLQDKMRHATASTTSGK